MNTFSAKDILVKSVDSEILQSMYRRKHKHRENLNTQLFSELAKDEQEWFSALLVLKSLARNNEVLLVISVKSRTKWIALSNVGVYYVNNGLKKINYVDISECSANVNKIRAKGFVDFIENQDIEIITKEGKKILLIAADTGHVNQTLADLISWAVHQVNLSIQKPSPVGQGTYE
jgi:hypothetical protein